MKETVDKKEFINAFNYKVIYVFAIEDKAHEGLLKIGDATLHCDQKADSLVPNCNVLNKAALARIKQYTNTAGLEVNLHYTALAVREVEDEDGKMKVKAFRDHDVHDVLKNSGIKKEKLSGTTASEWFRIDLGTALAAIEAVKKGEADLSHAKSSKHKPIEFRLEQKRAVEFTIKNFKRSDRTLWYAKMRFGKTLSALEVVKRSEYKRTLILTHRPVVNDGWYDDFTKIFYDTDYRYGSKSNGCSVKELLKEKSGFVYFASIQDLRGSEAVGGKFNKNDDVFTTAWDLVIVDEAHEGTTTELGDETIKALQKKKLLELSGTPFNLLDNYDEASIFTWDYIMEQEAKAEWDKQHPGEPNPYDELPTLRIYTYSLGDLLKTQHNFIEYEDKAFNFHEFFRTWTGDPKLDGQVKPKSVDVGDFIHRNDVLAFLDLMTTNSKTSAYPYSKKEYQQIFRHSLWMVPGVKEAKALETLMKSHSVFNKSNFKVVNVAGNEESTAIDPLGSVRTAIKEAEESDQYTITLSCGKLTTGVTVREWTAVLMLAGSSSTSAANYLQTIFRVQTPCNKDGMIKDAAYVFDFAPDRTLKMVAASVSISHKAGKVLPENSKVRFGKFLNFCPVIAVSGSTMEKYSVDRLLQQLKRAYAEKAIQNGFDEPKLYNDELLMLDKVDIEKFNNLKRIIGSSSGTSKVKDITINDQGLTKEQYEKIEDLSKKSKKELTPEEKEQVDAIKKARNLRAEAIKILSGLSIRIPLLIYGSEISYDEDVTLDRFVDEVDELSWAEFMPVGVTKKLFNDFRKYYDEDIFVAAGHRIREVARSADDLDPTERTKKLSKLFACFKNPDKETVLTPWRVVNMHISEALGGYDFFDESHTKELEDPRFVDKGQVTAETFGNEKAQILEINSKTGLYPLYVAYSIYRTRCKQYDPSKLTLDLLRNVWSQTIEQNVFVICKTPMARCITNRTLVGYSSNLKINTLYVNNLVSTLRSVPKKFVDKVLKPSYWKKEGTKMKFDAVVGNPPYQLEGGSTRKTPIYNYFYDASFLLSDLVTLITPARFLFNVGQTPKNWNEKILNDENFKVVKYFSNSKDVFGTVEIKGGVVIALRNSKKNYGKTGVFTPFNELNIIKQKVVNYGASKFLSLADLVSSQGIYRFSDVAMSKFDEIKELSGGGTGCKIVSKIINQIPSLFTDKPSGEGTDVLMLGRISTGRIEKYIKREYLQTNDYIDTYNVLVPESNGSGAFDAFSSPVIAPPSYGSTDTFISIGTFRNKSESLAVVSYIKTKFLRALLGVKKATQHAPKAVWKYVPLQDFTTKSDIDWTKSIPEIDKQLYAKYGLSKDEIAFIEEKVKPMA